MTRARPRPEDRSAHHRVRGEWVRLPTDCPSWAHTAATLRPRYERESLVLHAELDAVKAVASLLPARGIGDIVDSLVREVLEDARWCETALEVLGEPCGAGW